MTRYVIAWGIFCLFLVLPGCGQSVELTDLTDPWLGQEPPGSTPVLFAPGVVSTDAVELNAVFTHRSRRFYFTRRDSTGLYTIMTLRRIGKKWTMPAPAPFSGAFIDADPAVSPDGKLFLFISKRPDREPGPPYDILYLQRSGREWGEPLHPGPPLNTEHNEIFPSISRRGSFYFTSDRPGGLGARDIYCCRFENGTFTVPELVGPPISTVQNEGDVFIAPDESWLIFVAIDRPDGYGSGDLYVSFPSEDGGWGEPVNLGAAINTEGYDYGPALTPDGRFFFYTAHNDIWWVDAGIITDLAVDR